jgi:4-amino-4-deoxy-L-arabinose transferase-like glycosyltransferase
MAERCALSFGAVSSGAPNKALLPVPDSLRRGTALALPAAIALLYALGHLDWYLGTPLGRVPVLDERENLDLSAAILGGSLPREPFYRAPGYALALAGIRWMGVPAAGLFPAALLLGAVLHALNAALVARIAGRWFGNRAALLGGLLFALDPVLVHYATQALDNTLALTLFLAGLNLLVAAALAPHRARLWAGAGISWAAATLVRPSYLLPWALVPALAAFPDGPWRARLRILGAASAGIVLFAAASAWQWRACGVAGFLPWQGSYNLWAANRPGANGRYYTQRMSLPPSLARENPARAESVILYELETGDRSADIAAMGAHWRARFLDEVSSHPARWAALLARKAYALLNNWEQYNNKTFAFHKALSPWLRWNPICWGFLLVLAVAGAARLGSESRRAAWTLAAVSASCAAGILLFFASARFRLPLAAICAALAGGALDSPAFWRGWPAAGRASLAAAVALAGLAAFSNLGGIQDRSTFVQDHVLLARAAFTVGDDATALSEATEALKMQPWHPDAKAIADAARAELSGKPAK